MAEFISSNGTHTNTGTYDFRVGTLILPSGATLPSTQGANISFITPSGKLAIFDGSAWKVLSVSIPGAGWSGLYPSQLPSTVSGAITEWLEPSGFTLDGATASGITTWERNTFGVFGNSTSKWTQATQAERPSIESGTLNGFRNVYFGGVNGQVKHFEPGSAFNQNGDDKARTFIYVLENVAGAAGTSSQVILSFSQNSLDTRYIMLTVNPLATHGAGNITYQKTGDGSPNIAMNMAGGLPYNTPTIISVVDSGTIAQIYRNGLLLGTSGMDVDTQTNINTAAMGFLIRANPAGYCSGIRVWEAIHCAGSGLEPTDRAELENYLSSKYGIALER